MRRELFIADNADMLDPADFADQRIGEILRELPKSHGNQYDKSLVGAPTKREAEKQAGIGHATPSPGHDGNLVPGLPFALVTGVQFGVHQFDYGEQKRTWTHASTWRR